MTPYHPHPVAIFTNLRISGFDSVPKLRFTGFYFDRIRAVVLFTIKKLKKESKKEEKKKFRPVNFEK